MPIVTLPSGQEIEFPEGMSPDAMASAIRRMQAGGAEPSTTMGSIAQGAFDPIQGGAQALTQMLPRGVVEAVNAATGAVNRAPVIGPITRALGMTPATPEDIQQQTVARERAYQQSRVAAGDTGVDLPRMAGSLVPATALALATRNPQSLAGSIGVGGLQGGLLGLAEPVTTGEFAEEKPQQVGTGAALGAALGPLGYAVGRAIAPNLPAGVKELAAEGVQMTPGQVMGGIPRSVESALTSVPFLGPRIAGAMRESVESFNTAAANRALAPIEEKIVEGPVGRDLISFVNQKIANKYQDIFSRSSDLVPDQELGQDIAAVLRRNLLPDLMTSLRREVDDRIIQPLQAGRLTAEEFKEIISDIRKLSSDYKGSAVGSERKLGDAFKALRTSLQNWFERTNPNLAPELKAADQAYANFKRLSQASASSGAVEGVFTPAQLSTAVRAGDESLDRARFARGEALMQDLSDRARSVLPPTIPDSGTAIRQATGALATGSSTMSFPYATLAALAGLYGAYTPAARQAFQRAMVAPRGAATQAIGREVAGAGGALGQPLISPLVNPRESLLQ
jgi:hypothetical protein